MPMTAEQTYDCWCVCGPEGKPLWYTVRPDQADSITVYTNATRWTWIRCVKLNYTVRKMRMTEVK